MKKKANILVGTHNKGKFRELSYLLPKKLNKISPDKFDIKSPKETGKTFLDNSKIKAKYFFKKTKLTSLSDDSGLSVNCLSGKPGINSARYAIKCGGFKKAMKKIIQEVEKKNKNKKKKNFKAEFICSLSIFDGRGKFINSIGRVKGQISNKIIGKNGFGYDPFFIPNNYRTTFGQMSKRKKMKMDHRFQAYKKLKKKVSFL
jgi:XTP/dITP diphosphohydrolase